MRETLRIFVPTSLVRRFTLKVKAKQKKYQEIERAILQARIPITVQRFVALSKFYSYLSLLIGTAIGVILFYLISPSFILFISSKTPFYQLILSRYYILSKVFPLFGILIGFISYKLVSYLILSYPFFIANRRKSEIDLYLLDAINMMYGMAVGGLPAYNVVKTIAESRHIFGELSKEFGIVVEMVEVFREDFYDAMRFVRDTTPSKRLASFLDNMIYVLQGGGKLSDFLKTKSEELTEEREVTFESFIEFMGIVAEIYLSLFVLLPLFLFVILVVMKLVGQDVLLIFRNVIILILPISAYMLLWLIKSSLPSAKIKLEKIEERYAMLKANVSDEVRWTFSFDKFKRTMRKLRRIILYPFEESIYTIQIRFILPHLLLLSAVIFAVMYNRVSFQLALLIPLSALLLPIIVVIEVKERLLKKTEENIPDVFAELAMLNEAGLTIFEGLKILSTTEMGVLTREINILRRELEWGMLIPRAFTRLGMRIRSDLLSKIIPIVVKALEVSPTVKDAFNVVASYAETEIRFKKRLRSSMFLYVVIIYMSIGVFLFIAYLLIKNFLSAFSGINVSGSMGFGTLNIEFVKELFFQITFVVAVISGIIAGVIGEGKVSLGIKHAYIFAVLTYILFYYII